MPAELSEYTPEQVEEMRREAISNVRRTCGKVRFEDILRIKQPSDFEPHSKEYSSNLESKAISEVRPAFILCPAVPKSVCDYSN